MSNGRRPMNGFGGSAAVPRWLSTAPSTAAPSTPASWHVASWHLASSASIAQRCDEIVGRRAAVHERDDEVAANAEIVDARLVGADRQPFGTSLFRCDVQRVERLLL